MINVKNNTMNESCCGVILAGGLARRMDGQPKHALKLAGSTLLEHVIRRAQPQVDQLLLNVNPPVSHEIASTLAQFNTNIPIIEDTLAGHLGPLAGILSALQWMQKHSRHQWLASFAVDSPLFPKDLVSSLQAARLNHLRANTNLGSDTETQGQLVCPTYAGHKQPTFCLWHIDQTDSLKRWLVDEKNYRMGAWLKRQNALEYKCDHDEDVEKNPADNWTNPFTNINTPEELAQLELAMSKAKP